MVVAVIPAYNEENTIGDAVCRILEIARQIEDRVTAIVVDDGSADRTAEVARAAGARVLRHPINRGLGAALSTGMDAALSLLRHPEGVERLKDPELNGMGFFTPSAFGVQNDKNGIMVTLDADGQHDPAEIPRVIEPIVKGEADVVIGSRFLSNRHPEGAKRLKDPALSGMGFFTPLRSVQNDKQVGIPLLRRLANIFGNFFTWLLFGIWVSDSQSGFRAFSGVAAERLRLRTSTMEVSSEIIREIIRLRLRLQEVPITVRYTSYSLSKGQGFLRGLETLWKLIILKFFR